MQAQPQKHFSTCTLCEAMCGIEVTTVEREIISIAGDKKNPFSEGHVCPKAAALKDLYDDPQRLRQPMRKTASGFEPIGWEEALDTVAEKLHGIQHKHGKDAVGVYLGNPNAHNMGSILFGPYFYRALNTHNRYSATSVDQLPHHIVSRQMFGHQLQIPIGDIDHTDYFMIIGGNPLASNGSIMTVPHIKRRLKAIQKRGGKVVVIDPKKSETADISCDHHFIKPGSDVLLMLAMLHTLFAKGLVDAGELLEHAPDLLQVEAYVESYSPERVAKRVGISSEEIETMVSEFCAAKSAFCYGRMGASVQVFGTLTQYLIMLFNMLSGNFNRRGGMMFTQPAADTLPHSGRGTMGKYSSRVRKLPAFAGEYPVAALSEEITTPGDGQIKAMVIGGGNPVLTTSNGKQLDKAFEQLEFVAAVDFYITETSRHADIILPPVTALERDHYDVVFHNFAVRNSAKFSPALFSQPADTKTDWQIYLGLAERIDHLNGKATEHYAKLWEKEPTGVVDDMLKSGRYANGEHDISIQTLRDQPHGIDLGPLQPELPGAIYHTDKKISMAFDYFMADLPRVEHHFFSDSSPLNARSAATLDLIGRRHLKSNNSWLHNSPRMMKGVKSNQKGQNPRCSAQIHPDDAARFNIKDGQFITVTSRVGQVEIAAELTEKIMPGVISIPHGWGHNKAGSSWSLAEQNSGVSVNDLTDEMCLDELSGNAVLNGVPVTIAALESPPV
ncbi:Formate dehydrogenase [Paraglaciecola sp. T6c]|uniref:molybdopterin-dependent oxidoreductase n=1 Tax=Pseudoalteromonas atlantica (strain T6c / ATCC BAA-1087) TaxID=3042615 RepID=UPI00005C53B7|nr:molybdopterin-dependent oxidoreductase [Paraglaciecola sp. T6c]ABG40754.1 Formate dehydrogenase [Paraglaciecola sp. T6c]